MKRVLIWCLLLASIAVAGVVCGYYMRKPEWTRRQKYSVISSCGGGRYSNTTYYQINDELETQIDLLIGTGAKYRNIVVVSPMPGSGYDVTLAGPGSSKLWKDGTERRLMSWIEDRMSEFEVQQQQNSEPGGRSGGDKPAVISEPNPPPPPH